MGPDERSSVATLLRRLAREVDGSVRAGAAAGISDPVVAVLLAGDEWTAAAEVLCVDRADHLRALGAGQLSGEPAEEWPGDWLSVAIERGTSVLEVRVPDPRRDPSWWGLPERRWRLVPAPAIGRVVRSGLDGLRRVLGHPGGSRDG